MGKKGTFVLVVEFKGESLPQKKTKRAPLGNRVVAPVSRVHTLISSERWQFEGEN